MKNLLIILLMYSLPYNLLQAKTITESDGTQYQCTKLSTCDEKLKQAYAEIARLKKQKPREVVVEKIVEAKQNKNLVVLEGRRDILGVNTTVSGNQTKTVVDKDLVLGLDYYRRDMFKSNVGLGIGLDTNGVIKGLVGLSF